MALIGQKQSEAAAIGSKVERSGFSCLISIMALIGQNYPLSVMPEMPESVTWPESINQTNQLGVRYDHQ